MRQKVERVRIPAEQVDPCDGCHECAMRCTSGVPITKREFEAIVDYLRSLDFEEVRRVLDQEKVTQWFEDITRECCIFLDMKSKMCLVYPARPLICRLFGKVEWLPCPVEREVRVLKDGLSIIKEYAKEPRQTFAEWQMESGLFDLNMLLGEENS